MGTEDLRFVMAVEIVRGDPWYRVLLGIEPNGSNGWVRARDVTFVRVRHRLTIDLSERMLHHYRNGHLRHRFSVGIGATGHADDRRAVLRVGAVAAQRSVGPVRQFLPARAVGLLGGAHRLARRRPDRDPWHRGPSTGAVACPMAARGSSTGRWIACGTSRWARP